MSKYIVLRGPARRSGGPRARGAEDMHQLAIETVEADDKQVAELVEDPGVDNLAPSIPTRLIQPFGEAQTAATKGTAWGVLAVQATPAGDWTGEGVKVAVLDTGIASAHEAFKGVKLVEQDFTSEGNGDQNGHGTHCAGTIFGRDVAGVRIGVARGVRDALIGKVLDRDGAGESETMFRALQWAMEQGANVISMSLGFDFPGIVAARVKQMWPPDLATSAALDGYRANLRMFDALMAVARARAVFGGGSVIVAAAGNESKRQINKAYRISASLPAAAEDVISVGAVGRSDAGYVIADFSNSRPVICAPGVGVQSAAFDGGLATMSGTSMAAPHVAGVAALWWEYAQKAGLPATASTIVAKLRATARTHVLAPGTEVIDRGVGLVTAPGPAAM